MSTMHFEHDFTISFQDKAVCFPTATKEYSVPTHLPSRQHSVDTLREINAGLDRILRI